MLRFLVYVLALAWVTVGVLAVRVARLFQVAHDRYRWSWMLRIGARFGW